MKRHLKTASVFIFSALALVSCAKTEEFQYNPDSALQIASVSGISPFTLMQNPVSKAVITGESLPGEEAAKGIGLFVTAQDGGAYDDHANGYTNVKYTFDGSKWSAQTPIYLSDTEGKLYGYFPYNADATDLRAIPVASSLNGTDYLYATPQEVSFTDKSIELKMKHVLSRLHLTIVMGENYKAGGVLSGITLTGTAIGATGTMDLTDGTVTAQKGAGNMGVVQLAADGTINKTGITKDILLVTDNETAVSSDLSILLAIDGTVAGVNLSSDNGVVICQGVQYNLTLTVEDSGIKVSGVGVGEWGEGGSQEVQIGKYTVTVKLSDDFGIAEDVMLGTYIGETGNSIVINATATSGKPILCLADGIQHIGKVYEKFRTFTITDVTKDITASICYYPELDFNSPVGMSGTLYGVEAVVAEFPAMTKGTVVDEWTAPADYPGRKVAIALKNVGATSIDGENRIGTYYDFYNALSYKELSGDWHLPSARDLAAIRKNLSWNADRQGFEWTLTDNSILFLPRVGIYWSNEKKDVLSAAESLAWILSSENIGNITLGCSNTSFTYLGYIRPVCELPGVISIGFTDGSATDKATLKLNGQAVQSLELLPGSEVTYSVENIADGYKFFGWYDESGTLVSKENPYKAVASPGLSLKADVGKGYSLTISLKPGKFGHVEHENSYKVGSSVTINALPYSSHVHFVEWQDSKGTKLEWANPHTFTIENDMEIIAVFEGLYPYALDGLFTIAADNGQGKPKRVFFSRGNLWFGPAESGQVTTYNFETNQYDFRTYPEYGSMLGGNYSTNSGTPQNSYGLFYWGDSPENGGELNINGTSGDFKWPDDKSDAWGRRIDSEGTWRTLTYDEWMYIVRDRIGARFSFGTVHGVPGMILFPDGINVSDGKATIGNVIISNVNNASTESYPVISDDDWSFLQSVGMIFLPNTGFSNSNLKGEVFSTGSAAFYWSSSGSGDLQAYAIALRELFSKTPLEYRARGYCVRLVTDVVEQ